MGLGSEYGQNLLTTLKESVREAVTLQKQEDMVPDPPGFIETIEAFKISQIFKSSVDLEQDQEDLDSTDEEDFDPDYELHMEISGLLLEMHKILGIKKPEKLVDEYPFKTEGGKKISDYFDRIHTTVFALAENEDFELLSQKDFWILSNEVQRLIDNLEEEFEFKKYSGKKMCVNHYWMWMVKTILREGHKTMLHIRLTRASIHSRLFFLLRLWINFKIRHWQKKLKHFTLLK